MEVGISSSKLLESKSDILIFLTEEETKTMKKSPKNAIQKLAQENVSLSSFKGKLSDTLIVPVRKKPFKRILLSGLGKKKAVDLETVRRATHVGLRKIASLKLKHILATLPTLEFTDKELVRAISDGLRLSNYDFDKYKTEKGSKLFRVSKATILVPKVTEELKKTLFYSKVTCDANYLVRDLQSDDADVVTPEYLVKVARDIAKSKKLKIKVLNRSALKKNKLNMILGVGQGSRFEPHMIIIEYKGNPKSKEKIALVGKGITYDTGGLDIKTRMMAEMNMDMSGAAVVLAAIKAISELGLNKNVIAVAPVCENAVSANSQKPGSVLKSYSGKTVEVGNTDAEGRLILADAMAYTVKNYKPTKIVDFATLTGAVIAALGHNYAGLFSTDQDADKILSAGESSGELVWRMPLPKDYAEFLKSSKADLNNISNYPGYCAGAITAALFLKEFVGDTPWTHIDIAGTARSNKRKFYNPPMGTGFGPRLVCDFLSGQ